MDMNSPMEESMMIMIKGKRTKRPRPSSPSSAVITTTSSCSSGGGGGRGEISHSFTIHPASASACSEISTSTEEDEDMANCLILLAQSTTGGSRARTVSTTIHISGGAGKPESKHVEEGQREIKAEKFINSNSSCSSKKFSEMAITTSGGKAGIFVYECKTCNRSFPSFQALGGHRASHKRPKPTVETTEEKKEAKIPPSDDDHAEKNQETQKEKKFLKLLSSSPFPPPLPLQQGGGGGGNKYSPSQLGGGSGSNVNINNNKVKIHECSICGAEFSSGQALGGHMRRHRNVMPINKVSMMSSFDTTTTTTTTTESSQDGGERARNILELDLNLPAPPEDDHHGDSQFQFSVFTSQPALVDCQY